MTSKVWTSQFCAVLSQVYSEDSAGGTVSWIHKMDVEGPGKGLRSFDSEGDAF